MSIWDNGRTLSSRKLARMVRKPLVEIETAYKLASHGSGVLAMAYRIALEREGHKQPRG